MKKTAFIMAVIMMFALGTSAFAQDNMRDVLVSVKERIDIPAECSEFSSSSHSSGEDVYYQFTWSTPIDEKENYANVSISATATGIITSMNSYKNGDYRTKSGKVIPLISKEQAIGEAEKFLIKVNSEQAAEYDFGQATAQLYDYSYSVTVPRIHNGIRTTDSANIGVNSRTAEINSFYMSYVENAVFPSIDSAISLDEAKEAFKDGALKKIYSVLSDEKKATPVFSSTGFYYVDAISGERFEPTNSGMMPYAMDKEMALASDDGAMGDQNRAALTPEEVSVVEEVEGLLSAAEIEGGLREIPELLLDDLKCEHSNLVKSDGNYIFTLRFEGENAYAYITADAETGRMLSMHGYEYTSVSREDEVYNEFIEKYYSDYLDSMTMTDDETYVRVVNGIEFPQNYMSAYKEKDSDKLSGFTLFMSENIEFAPLAGTLSEDDGYEALYKAALPQLMYVWDGDSKEAIPVYSLSFDYFSFIDAVSGLPINTRGEVQKEAAQMELTYSDVGGHYAREAILALATIGAGFEGGAFEPEQVITQKEYATLVSKCIWDYEILRGGAADLDATAKYVLDRGFIKEEEFFPDSPLSRELAVAILLRFMGYEDFASIDGIFRTDYLDESEIDKDMYGYVAIATGLKIVNGSGGYFNPKENLTRGQAATVIYNYLKN